MPQKASTPWSVRTISEGGTDSPVGDLVPVPDKITPVVNTGFIATTGKYQGIIADDRAFTFQDPEQALGPGADMEFNVDMLQHEIMILALLDSSGNNINVDIIGNNSTTLSGPYSAFSDVGTSGTHLWKLNKSTVDGVLKALIEDESELLAATWKFYKFYQLRGTQIRLVIHNNDGAAVGVISTAYLRLV